ncbi:MAG: ubiquinol-cytochrome c reductase iron-sulfur subunit [Planctomycetaceae bacterium]
MEERVPRRRFLRQPLGLAGLAAILFGVVAPLVEMLFGARGRRAGGWRGVARLDALQEGAPVPFAFDVRAGWRTSKAQGFLVRRGDGVAAFRAECTHLGCRVRPQGGEFRCPCHGGAFGLDGAPLRGPVTRPLDRLEARVVDGRVEVKS